MVVVVLLLLLLLLGVVCAEGEVRKHEYYGHGNVTAKEAVREKYLKWVEGWGHKYAAKRAKAVGVMVAGQERPRSGAAGMTIVVDQVGRGDVSTVQAAVNRVPVDNQQRVTIQINPGTYW